MIDGNIAEIGEIRAKDYDLTEAYWEAHQTLIMTVWPDHFVYEGYRLYNHAGQEANKQANSQLETPQLIGVLRMSAYSLKIPTTVQSASQAKTRWSDKVLQAKGILDEKNRWNGKRTNKHMRDSMRHALHFDRYGRG